MMASMPVIVCNAADWASRVGGDNGTRAGGGGLDQRAAPLARPPLATPSGCWWARGAGVRVCVRARAHVLLCLSPCTCDAGSRTRPAAPGPHRRARTRAHARTHHKHSELPCTGVAFEAAATRLLQLLSDIIAKIISYIA